MVARSSPDGERSGETLGNPNKERLVSRRVGINNMLGASDIATGDASLLIGDQRVEDEKKPQPVSATVVRTYVRILR